MLLVIVLNIIVLTTQISIHGGKEEHNHSHFKTMEDLNIFEYAEVC